MDLLITGPQKIAVEVKTSYLTTDELENGESNPIIRESPERSKKIKKDEGQYWSFTIILHRV